MALPHNINGDSDNAQSTFEFIETARYYEPSSSSSSTGTRRLPVPHPWCRCVHPNGDIYYYNPQLRLVTPEDIRDPTILGSVLEAREEHLQAMTEDPSTRRLPSDWELSISDVSEHGSVIGMHSRMAGASYKWSEETGLRVKGKEYFWSYVAEFTSHHAELPPNTEAEFVQALKNTQAALLNGDLFPFSSQQIEQVISRYHYLKNLQSQGRDVNPALAWLMGAVMPLDAVGRRFDEGELEALMGDLHF